MVRREKRDRIHQEQVLSTRAAIGREAYRLAEAFIAAKDAYIRELPVSHLDAGF